MNPSYLDVVQIEGPVRWTRRGFARGCNFHCNPSLLSITAVHNSILGHVEQLLVEGSKAEFFNTTHSLGFLGVRMASIAPASKECHNLVLVATQLAKRIAKECQPRHFSPSHIGDWQGINIAIG